MAGWNFFLYEALIIPFEITALTTVLGYWSDNIPGWAVPIACIFLYGLINILAVRAYGEAEFWLSGGKVILILLLFCFTFITMVSSNAQCSLSHTGVAMILTTVRSVAIQRAMPMVSVIGTTLAGLPSIGLKALPDGLRVSVPVSGRHLFVSPHSAHFHFKLLTQSLGVVGPEYISMVSAEAVRPRVYIKQAFKTVYIRLAVFFVGGALAAGIVVAYNVSHAKTRILSLFKTSTYLISRILNWLVSWRVRLREAVPLRPRHMSLPWTT